MTITMYGADWCGDCRRAKAWFEDRGLPYTYVDLVVDPDETERVLERNNGVQKIPLIVFPDDSQLVEPSNTELSAHVATLEAAGVDLHAQCSPIDDGPAVIENVHLGRFELLRGGEVVGFASYRGDGNRVVVPHVETAPQHRGQGYAAELMEGMLALLRKEGRTITPLCPYAAAHIRDREQHHDLLS